jgi:hypothetical protein
VVTEQVEVEEVEVFRVVSSSAALALAATACTVNLPHLNYTYTRCSCCLVMEYIPGGCLFKAAPAWAGGAQLAQTAEDLGRLFTLDMLLGNADRLHCDELGWRGNPGAGVGWGWDEECERSQHAGCRRSPCAWPQPAPAPLAGAPHRCLLHVRPADNILYATGGRWAGRAVAIDAVVQRRPPGGLTSVEVGGWRYCDGTVIVLLPSCKFRMLLLLLLMAVAVQTCSIHSADAPCPCPSCADPCRTAPASGWLSWR